MVLPSYLLMSIPYISEGGYYRATQKSSFKKARKSIPFSF